MYLISIDPGVSTGVAVFKHTKLLETWTFEAPYDELRALLRRSLREHGEALHVVVEKGPEMRRHLNREVQLLEQLVREEVLKLYWVRPSRWKPHPASRLPAEDVALIGTVHTRDAARMGRYFLTTGGHDGYERIAAA